ncbi:hypothetical protein AAIA72_10530 [Hahella sp. SMD15-11]|uniref:Chemotaxis protein n=1 Tax=Thermohahella caldifontis TaxID=3142973 RepID=A0AB39UTC8_9GAMM
MLTPDDIDELYTAYHGRPIPRFVVSATLATELSSTIRVARRISISSKNAQAITARAGAWGQGFSGITQFIDEFSRNTIDCANRISDTSQHLSQSAVTLIARRSMAGKLARVVAADPGNAEVRALHERYRKNAAELEAANERSFSQLHKLIEEIRDCTRALNSIVATCRIEASRAGPFQQALFVIAADIEEAAGEIDERIKVGRKILDMLGRATTH